MHEAAKGPLGTQIQECGLHSFQQGPATGVGGQCSNKGYPQKGLEEPRGWKSGTEGQRNWFLEHQS